MKFSSKQRAVVAALLMLLVLFLLRPGVSRLKSRVIFSMSSALGRSVDIGSVQLRFFPRPGFDMQNLVVYDDPAFGAEPILRAGEVSAALRLTSLLRGRLEIARLDLSEPSLNLVRGEHGGWNLEALLERSAHTPLAPTAKSKSEARPSFPYIQGSAARINLKYGAEKKPYALTNADFALWQESENAWGVRLKAQPFRSDFNLNDIGSLQVNGTWQRASLIRDTPLQFSVEWSRAQLGQLTKFFSGVDQGWRGAAQFDATFTGTPADLKIVSDISIRDFRRYDITSGDALRLAVHCDAQYSSPDHTFQHLDCHAPVGDGVIRLSGETGLPGSHHFDLKLAAEKVPATAAVAIAERTKRNLPEDLTAAGTIDGSLSVKQESAAAKFRCEGRGDLSDFRLSSNANKIAVGPQTIPLVFSDDSTHGPLARRGAAASAVRTPEGPHVNVGPFPVGTAHALSARAWADHLGYSISLSGETEIARTLRLARMIGVPALPPASEGTAQVDLQIAGSWSGWSYGAAPGFAGPQVTGTATLHNVRVPFRGAGAPAEIVSAQVELSKEEVRLEKLNLQAADALWTGWITLPRGCGTPGACVAHFNLNANAISFGHLHEWLSPPPAAQPWYRMLESNVPAPPLLESLRAAGRVTADRLSLQSATATHVTAKVEFDRGTVKISQLSGDFSGGRLGAEWQADASAKPGTCTATGNLSGVSLARLSSASNDHSLSGVASATFDMKGPCTPDFWAQAEGTLRFKVSDAALSHFSLPGDEEPLKISLLAGQARLQAGRLEVTGAQAETGGGKFLLSGSASWQRELDLKLTRPGNGSPSGFAITGTLTSPRVEPLPGDTQARLKR